MNMQMKKPKTPQRTSTVKSFEYTEAQKQTRAVMCKLNNKFGVVMFSGDTAFARDYKNPSSDDELRTYVGNEVEIIDWVSLDEAEGRYADLLTRFLSGQTKSVKSQTGKPLLRLVR